MYDKELGLLFIHIPKTAGQSISKWMGDRIGMDWGLANAWKYFRLYPAIKGHANISHATAQEYVDLEVVTQEEFDSATKMAVVRNTWDRVLSEYHFKYTGSFKNFVEGALSQHLIALRHNLRDGLHPANDQEVHLRSQIDFIRNKEGKQIVDVVLRFENLQEEFSKFCNHFFNINDSELTFENIRRPKKIKHYSEMYTTKEITKVGKIYEEEIEYFGFEFEEK